MVDRAINLYLCDGKKDCQMSPFCGVNNRDTDDDENCYYTSDYEHAKNKGKEMKFEEILNLYFNEDGYNRIFWEVE